MKIRTINLYLLIAILEFAIGFCILIWSIYGYYNFFSIEEAEQKFGGLVDFLYYKESMYKYFFAGTITCFSGICYIINKKIHWFATHSLIIFCFLSIELPFLFSIIKIESAIIFFQVILLTLFILLETLQIKNLNKRNYSDKKKIIILSSILGVFLGIIFLFLQGSL